MGNNSEQLLMIFNIILIVMLSLLGILLLVFVVLKIKENMEKNKRKIGKTTKSVKEAKSNSEEIVYDKKSVLDFMEFDAIEDSMIIRKNGKKFVMVIKCNGSNYDLASENEKIAIESGFVQFLNTLTYPIQIYIQTRKFNIEESILTYKEKLRKLERDAISAKTEYEIARRTNNPNDKRIRDAFLELQRTNNIYEYAKDVIKNTEILSMNKNVLRREHYIAITYSPLEEVAVNEMYDEEEMKDKAFSELYTRAQSLIRVLSGCDVISKILTSVELAELLYVAYNREQYEVYGLEKVLNSNYDQLYVTAPDVLDKKIARLDAIIEERAGKKATELVNRVKSEKEKRADAREENLDELVREMTKIILDQNENVIGAQTLKEAKKILDDENKNDKAVKETNETEEERKTKSRRTRTTKIKQ